MIGINIRDNEKAIAKEFFNLFKVPWEYYNQDESYDVVITSYYTKNFANTKLVIIYDSRPNALDLSEKVEYVINKKNQVFYYKEQKIVIFNESITFNEYPGLIPCGRNGPISFGYNKTISNVKYIRIGYNIFKEVLFLLNTGQPSEFSEIPLLEIHITMLREWILDSNIYLVEILSKPFGYESFACLTHDVDFVKIADHFFDTTFFGFIYRASISSLVNLFKGLSTLKKVLKNLLAILYLPFVYIGFKDDIWLQFDNYLNIENKLPSTFYFIPYKNRPGYNVQKENKKRRATKYEVNELKNYIKKIISHGGEIGVHGIDNWHDFNLGLKEFKKISWISKKHELGNRVHWLCFNDSSFKNLEQASFTYDSTFGYNDAIGFKAGTVRPFKPIGVKKLIEVPLNIQDNALFRNGKSTLSEAEAFEKCCKIFDDTEKYGGVATILWHLRSIAPERLWNDFYIRLIDEMKKRNYCFRTALEISKWYFNRNAIKFRRIDLNCNKLNINVCCTDRIDDIPYILRIYYPKKIDLKTKLNKQNFIDISLKNNIEISFNFNTI